MKVVIIIISICIAVSCCDHTMDEKAFSPCESGILCSTSEKLTQNGYKITNTSTWIENSSGVKQKYYSIKASKQVAAGKNSIRGHLVKDKDLEKNQNWEIDIFIDKKLTREEKSKELGLHFEEVLRILAPTLNDRDIKYFNECIHNKVVDWLSFDKVKRGESQPSFTGGLVLRFVFPWENILVGMRQSDGFDGHISYSGIENLGGLYYYLEKHSGISSFSYDRTDIIVECKNKK